jgi:VanZ family protein
VVSLTQEKNWRVRLWAYAPILLWVGFIFFLSSDSGSSAQTSRFVRPLLHFLFPAATESTIDLYHHYIRKAAHFTEYAILAMLAARSLLRLRPTMRFWPGIVLGFVALVACLDELYQTLNASRTPSPYDSLLDFSGGAFAVVMVWFVGRLRARRVSSPDE